LIQRKLNAGSFTDLVKVVFGSNAYADSYNLSGGNTYYYRICKVVNNVVGDWSNEVSVAYTSGGANYKTITGTVVGVRANIKRVGKIITKSEVAARTLLKRTCKIVTTSEVGLRTLLKRLWKPITKSEVGSANLIKQGRKVLSKAVTSYSSLTKIFKWVKTITQSVIGLRSLVKRTGKIITKSEVGSTSLRRQINKIISKASAFIATLISIKGLIYKMISTTSVGVRALVKRTGKIITKSEVATASLRRIVWKIVIATEVAQRSITKRILKPLSKVSSFVATLIKRIGKPIIQLEVGYTSLRRTIRKTISKVPSFVAVLEKAALGIIYKTITVSTNMSLSLRRAIRKTISKVPSFVAVLNKGFFKPLLKSEVANASLRRTIRKPIIKALAFSRSLVKGYIYSKILTPSKPELITNGGFETGNMTGWTYLNFGVSAGGGFGTYSSQSNDDNAYLYQNLDTSQGLNISWYQKYTVTSGGSLTLTVDSEQIGIYPLQAGTPYPLLCNASIDARAGTHSIKWTFTKGASDWAIIDNISAKRPAFIPSVRRRIGKPIIQFETGVTSLRRRINKIVSKVSAFVSILISQKLAGLIFKTISIAGVGVRSLIKRTGKPIIKTESAVVSLIKRTGKNVVWLEAGVAVLRKRVGKILSKASVSYAILLYKKTISKILSVISVAGTNKIVNGGFETGTISGWSKYEDSGTSVSISGSYYHTGIYGVRFDTPSIGKTCYIYQDVDLTGVSTLEVWGLYGYNGGFITIDSDIKQSGLDDGATWTKHSVDVSSYSGVHTIKIGQVNTTGSGSAWVADDVSTGRVLSLRRRIGKPITQLETGSVSIRRRINKIVSKVSAFIAVLEKATTGIIYKTIAVSTTMGLSIRRKTTKLLSKTSTFISIINKRVLKIITKSETAISILRRRIGKPIIKAETGIVSLRRKIGKLLAKVSTFVAALGLSGYVAIYYKTLTTVMASQVSLRRRISKTLSKIVSSVVRMWHDYFPGGWVDDTKRVTLHCKFNPQADVICKWDSTVTVGCNFETPSITLRCWMDRGV
jgi:hypothetical protein